ncbi:hypothetical protein HKK55_02290 [Pseudomonas sp. ADAK18]|uniref:hypothetical protein n=1 Tax=Pseudomonas sp. ADAK18 TaxID=2730848 RepID=UPI0014637A06|nr:hypothetical protein [Pseudomonas sp. ADAK18]QJI27580.1 hypothetical protein HKK55_02290 [Pseudomonas sp. ADAK18]
MFPFFIFLPGLAHRHGATYQRCAACYLLSLSYQLWQRNNSVADSTGDRFGGMYFFLLTVMNSKGLLIVSFIAPVNAFTELEGYLAFMATLAVAIIPVGFTWILLGAGFKSLQQTWLAPLKINRAASVAICCFAFIMIGRLADSVIN